ncbi:helix-turn-helix transcriptional regulator [Streptomyces platensis]|uniref:helix-turn-helix transcriptional regulator n=1 Tax=Streptomyces platensis TaxID=58346 RepID=UPI001F4256D2|nr:helix-turn-helix transcriptional regulator [Streptomyces platensis]MCF3142443.1 helix-turn-helix transcriptional regulator [Streptomyces platensis]
MNDRDLAAYLGDLGVARREAELFQALLQAGRSSAGNLGELLGWQRAEVEEAVGRLIDLGLVVAGGADGAAPLSPTEPSIALDRLVHIRSAEVREAQLAALHAYRDYRRCTGAQTTDDLVEVVTGPQIVDRIWQFEKAVESEVVRFDSPPYHTDGGANDVEVENLGRGVEYRVVYSSSAVQNGTYYAVNIEPCIAAGEQARVLSTVPVKLTVFDRRLAIVSMSSVEAESNEALLLVRPSSLLTALLGLFETAWRSGHPMHLSQQVPPALRPVQRRILELMGTGVTDDTIAQLLGISRRTLSRHTERLYQLAGATSRFQLALHAARKEWI